MLALLHLFEVLERIELSGATVRLLEFLEFA